jgi:hypothetical protein
MERAADVSERSMPPPMPPAHEPPKDDAAGV